MRLTAPERWLVRYFEEGSRPPMQVLQRLLSEASCPAARSAAPGSSTSTNGWRMAKILS